MNCSFVKAKGSFLISKSTNNILQNIKSQQLLVPSQKTDIQTSLTLEESHSETSLLDQDLSHSAAVRSKTFSMKPFVLLTSQMTQWPAVVELPESNQLSLFNKSSSKLDV